jgi:hypothetical protein
VSVDVQVTTVAAQPTAVIAAATTWEEFPRLWRDLLDEVWATMRALEGASPGRNVMLYKDDVPHVEVGVEVPSHFRGAGRVVGSELPAGRVVRGSAAGRVRPDWPGTPGGRGGVRGARADEGRAAVGGVRALRRGAADQVVDVRYLVE